MHINLINERKKSNLTIYDMAQKLDITAVHYYLIENNKRKLYYDMAIRIASIFNMKPDNLFYTKKSN